MQNRNILPPDGLVEIISILGIAAGVQHPGAGSFIRPEAFAQIVDARPHKAAHNVRASPDEFPQLFRFQGFGIIRRAAPHAVRRFQAVITPGAVDGYILRAQQQPIRMLDLFFFIEGLRPLPPAVGIIHANDVQLLKEFGGSGHRLGFHQIAGLGDGPRGVQAVAKPRQHLRVFPAVRHHLLPHLVANGPHHDGRMVAVPFHHGGHIGPGAGIEPFGIAPTFMGIGAEFFALHGVPFIKGFVQHAEAHFIRQIQQRRIRWIMAHAQRVAPHVLQLLKPLPPNLRGNRRAQTACVVMQTDTLQNDLSSIEGKPVMIVESDFTNTKGRDHFISQPVSIEYPCDRLIQSGAVDIP